MKDKSDWHVGTLEATGKDIAVTGIRYDRIAVSDYGRLLALSAIADTGNLKRLRAILGGGAKASLWASGGRVKKPSYDGWGDGSSDPGRIQATSEDGYDVWLHRLGYGMAHALFLTRMDGFMKVVTPESLWQELNDTRFTTPLLREWMPHIEKRLREDGLLQEAKVFNCACGLIVATTTQLDAIVQDGLRDGAIVIPKGGLNGS